MDEVDLYPSEKISIHKLEDILERVCMPETSAYLVIPSQDMK
jgi:hypothetical protein